MEIQRIPTYCMTCYNGPHPIKIRVEDGIAMCVEPNPDASRISPSEGRPCVKAYGLIGKLYSPDRVKSPLLRQNPKKGRNEDPAWKEIGWDEALDILAGKLKKIRESELVDEAGYPKLAMTLGGAGTPEGHFGTLPAFLSSWRGPIDLTLGSGQAVKCYHSDHVFGELWHRAFMVVEDLPKTNLILSFGHSTNASDGVGVWKDAEARGKGLKRIQIEPHLSVTGATADRWIPIKPKTDALFLCSMIHVILHEMDWKKLCDIEFIKDMTNSPYLVAPNGYFMRDKETEKPLIWDLDDNQAKVYDDESIKSPALTGVYRVSGIEKGADDDKWEHESIECKPSFQLLIELVKEYSPESVSETCGVPVETIRELTKELVESAKVGSTVEIEGHQLPFRPIAIILGKTVNNGPGGYETCWARTVLVMLLGALEVPGGNVGACSKLYPPYQERWGSVQNGTDGFMEQQVNPTEKGQWPPESMFRGPYTALTPLNGKKGWASGIAPFTLAWIFSDKPLENWPSPSLPEVWIVYRSNPVRTQFDTELVESVMERFPFTVHLTYILDETSWYADLVLPDHSDLEGLQLKLTMNRHWLERQNCYGYILKQPIIEPPHNTKDITDLWTELTKKIGTLEYYNDAINRGIIGTLPLKGADYDFSLERDKTYSSEEIWDRACKAVTRSLSGGKEEHGLDWFKEYSYYITEQPPLEAYLYPRMKELDLRFELPYQERITRIGEQLKRRMHERNIHWWDDKFHEYRALPEPRNFLEVWDKYYEKLGVDPKEYDVWLVATRSMQYAWTSNTSDPIIKEIAEHMLDFGGVVVNRAFARQNGIEDGDRIIVESPFAKKEGKVIVREGVRPDVAYIVGQFGQWITAFAKDIDIPNSNDLSKLDLDLLDAGGSSCDLVKVKIYKKGKKTA